jgi:hypothetical protein
LASPAKVSAIGSRAVLRQFLHDNRIVFGICYRFALAIVKRGLLARREPTTMSGDLGFGIPGQKGATMRGSIVRCGSLAVCFLAMCFLATGFLALGMRPVAALPLSEFDRVYPYLVRQAQICLMTSIPTQANPVRDADTLDELHRRLPDSFACGRCRYDLAGDPDATYYVRTCR